MKHARKNTSPLRPTIHIWRKRRFNHQAFLRPFTGLHTMFVTAAGATANQSLLFTTLTSIHNKNNTSITYSISRVPTTLLKTLTPENVLRWFLWLNYTSYSTLSLHLSYSISQITRFASLSIAPLRSNPRRNLPHLLPDKFGNALFRLNPLRHL